MPCPISGSRCPIWAFTLCCCYSALQSCLCNLTDCSTPGFSALRCLTEFSQIHVHGVSEMRQKPFREEVRAGTCGQAAGGRSAHRQRREGGPGEALGERLSSVARGTFYIHFRSVPGHSGVEISPPTTMQGTGHCPSSHRKSRPWPLEHSFHPERLTTNRSMSEENEAGRWGWGVTAL